MSSIQLSCSAAPFIGQKGRKLFCPIHIQTSGGSGFPPGALCFVRVTFVSSSKSVFTVQDITGLWNLVSPTVVESASPFNPVGLGSEFIAYASFFDPTSLSASDSYNATYRVEITDDTPQRNVIAFQNVPLQGTANPVQPATVVFALDHGHSMGNPVTPTMTRLGQLQAAFPLALSMLRSSDTFGVVAFGNMNCPPDPQLPLDVASDTQITNAINLAVALQVDESFPTSKPIQVGIDAARRMSPTGTLVLLTDGENNNTPGHKLTKPLPGTPTSALILTQEPQANYNILVSTNGEYALASSPLGTFAAEKLLAQILVGIASGAVISDPEGSLEPGEKRSFPLQITEADRELEVIVLSNDADAIEVHLEDLRAPTPPPCSEPNAYKVDPPPDKPEVVRSKRFVITRLVVPALPEKERPFSPKVVISRSPEASRSGALVHFSFIAAAKSDLKLDAEVTRSGTSVGSELLFSAVLSEYGQSLHSSNARVRVELFHPDGFSQSIELQPTPHARGRFQASIRSFRPGAYTAHFIATGQSLLHERPFRRELVRTVAVSEASDCCEPAPACQCMLSRN
ncbi:MAG TPA: hypothetical protein VER96_11560 [Polyangiaceae bacterium]|nr:hypothetical protein [Polyangiaceae bacterium]